MSWFDKTGLNDIGNYKVEKLNNIFGIDTALNLRFFFTRRGVEYLHMYFWIVKDIAWTQNMYTLAITVGLLAVLWCLVIAGYAIYQKKYLELYMTVGVALWLTGNFVWMQTEVSTQDDAIGVPRSSKILETAVAWFLFYYIILRPLNVLPIKSQLYEPDEDEKGLTPRYPLNLYFVNWRDYEHVHTLFWSAKDLCWNQLQHEVWWLCIIPTGLIALDFITTSAAAGNKTIACVHYSAIFLWVMGNAAWAYGNIYLPYSTDDTYPHSMFSSAFDTYDDYLSTNTSSILFNSTVVTYHSNPTNIHGRWEGTWIIFSAASLLAVFYILWIALSFLNKIYPSKRLFDQISDKVPVVDQTSLTEKSGVGGVDML
jgi:hypothetical protein